MGINCTDQAIPLYPQKLAQSSPTSGDRSVIIVRLWTKSHRICFALYVLLRGNTMSVTGRGDPYLYDIARLPHFPEDEDFGLILRPFTS